MIREEVEEPEVGTDTQEYVIGMEIADRIQEVHRELDEKDKQIFSMRFIKTRRCWPLRLPKSWG